MREIPSAPRPPMLTRRAAMGTGLATVGGLGTRRAQAQGRQIVVTDSGGETQQAFAKVYYAPFEARTGVKVNYAARATMAMGQLKAMVLSGNVEWDATFMTDYLVYVAQKENLLERIDTSGFNQAWLAQMLPGSCDDYSIGGFAFGTAMAYNTRKWKPQDAPRNWADFWDTKRFPGARSMIGIGYGPPEPALLASGVPMDRLYPLDLKRAFDKLNEIKPHVDVWSSSSAQQVQLLVNQEVDLLQGYTNRIQAAIDQGAPYEIVWNQASYQYQSWVIPRGARNKDLATQFIATTIDPEVQGKEAEMVSNGPENGKAFDHIAPARAKLLPTYPANLAQMFRIDARWLADNFNQVTNEWSRWKAQRG